MKTPTHTVAVIVSGVEIRGVMSYRIATSLTDGVASFDLRVAFSREAWDALIPDRLVQIRIDGVPVITGFIDDSDCEDGPIEVTGRCKIGRLIQDCSPAFTFAGLSIREQLAKIAAPFFSSVTLDNSRNRVAIRGKGKKARVARQAIDNGRVAASIEPGQTRWTLISQFCEQRGLLAWSSGDGRELVVARPNYGQEPQFRLFRPSPESRRSGERTVLSMRLKRSTGDRYSRIIVVGSGTGTDANYGAKVAARFGEAKDSPDTRDGEGYDFTVPKRLIMQRSVASSDEAEAIAIAEMSRRDGYAYAITATAPGHGQFVAGSRPTLFACDTISDVEDERTGTRGVYTIAACVFTSNGRDDGRRTELTLIPLGTDLSR